MQKCAAQVPRRCRDTAPPASTCAQPPLPRCPSMVAGPPAFINSVCVPRAPPLRACVGMPPPFFPPGASSVIAPLKSVITVCLWNARAQPPLPRCPRNLPKPLRCDAAIFPHPSECFASPCKLRRCATKCFQSLIFCASPRPPPFLHFAAPVGRPRVHHLQRLDHEKRVLKASCRMQSELLEPHTHVVLVLLGLVVLSKSRVLKARNH